MIRFDISDLRVFVNVVQSGSITRGAEKSNRAVASISARIKEMELAMGTPLLIRQHSGVVPTEAGRKLLGYAYRLLREVQQMNDDLADYGNLSKSFVKLHSNTVALYEFLQAPIARFLKMNPAMTLTIEELINDQIPTAVAEGRADIGVIAEPVDTKDLELISFVVDRYVVITPSSWPRPKSDRVRFVDFLDQDFVGPGRGTWMHTMLQQHAVELGKSLRNRVQLRSFSMTCELVAAEVGIGIVPASSARRMSKHLPFHILYIDEEWAQLPLRLCVRNRGALSPHAANLIEFLAHEGKQAMKLPGGHPSS